jgi:sugar O-acyltransferase (sialic acid O-acetyltransferase NeuD family)
MTLERTALVIGKGGQARVVASFLPHRRIRFLVEKEPGPNDILQSRYFAGAPDRDADHYVAIGANDVRREYFDRLKSLGITPANCIAPTAWIAPDATIGDGVFIGAGAVLGAGARLGDNVILNNLSLVDHDSVIGDDSQIAPGCIIGAELRVGRRCFFGMRSCLVSRVEVGDDVFVMAGAVIVRPVPSGVRVGGVPARLMPARE